MKEKENQEEESSRGEIHSYPSRGYAKHSSRGTQSGLGIIRQGQAVIGGRKLERAGGLKGYMYVKDSFVKFGKS